MEITTQPDFEPALSFINKKEIKDAIFDTPEGKLSFAGCGDKKAFETCWKISIEPTFSSLDIPDYIDKQKGGAVIKDVVMNYFRTFVSDNEVTSSWMKPEKSVFMTDKINKVFNIKAKSNPAVDAVEDATKGGVKNIK